METSPAKTYRIVLTISVDAEWDDAEQAAQGGADLVTQFEENLLPRERLVHSRVAVRERRKNGELHD